MKRRSLGIAALALAMLSCGSELSVERSVATLRAVRGAVSIDDEAAAPLARLAPGGSIRTGEDALARLELDEGARLLLAPATELTVSDEASVQLASGRAHVDASTALELGHGGATLRLSDAAASIEASEEALSAYVIRGELTYVAEGSRGVVSAGHRLVIDASGPRTEPAQLFSDWTGGLAEAGPEAPAPVGIGTLEARVPEEIGQARWPLVIRRLDVRVRVEGDLAITEIDQEFFNPASEMLEGLYRVRVPRGAILSRFAVDRNGRLVDGYVRERAQARRAYEQQVYRGSTLDPALLEWDGPEAYRARIYPIWPGQTRRIVVRWAEWLRAPSEGAPRIYRFPMGGERAPRISELSIEVELDGTSRVRAGLGAVREGDTVRLRRSDFVPRADFWLELFGDAPPAQRAWRAAHEPPPRDPSSRAVPNEADERDYWVAPIVLPSDDAAGGALDVVIVADVSAATDRARLELGRSAVESIANALGPDDRVAILAADLAIRDGEAALGPATAERTSAALEALARAPAEGASDLAETLARAASLLDPTRAGIVVYVGDGRATVGPRTARALDERLRRLPHPIRLYALAIGEDADLELLALAEEHGGLLLPVRERRDAAEAALDLLAHAARPVVHGVTITLGDGIENAYPRRPIDVVLGDVLPVVGRVRGERPRSITIRGTLAGEAYEREIELETIETRDTVDPRLRWASARLAHLLAEGASREEVVELGVRQGVITPYTSYYVPSAEELSRMGASALRLMRPDEPPSGAREAALALALGPLSIAGCGGSSEDDELAAVDMEVRHEELSSAQAVSEPSEDVITDLDALDRNAPPTQPAPRTSIVPAPAVPMAAPVEAAAPATAVEPAPEEPAPEEPMRPTYHRAARAGSGASANGSASSNLRAAVAGCAASASGPVTVTVAIDASGAVTGVGVSPSDTSVLACVRAAVAGLRFPGVGPTTLTVGLSGSRGPSPAFALAFAQLGPYAFAAAAEEARADAHRTRRCSDAASLPLDERRELWRERLASTDWSVVYRAARRGCELETWRDRRALLAAILDHAGSVVAMIAVARDLSASADRAFARASILRRVRTPEDVRALRAAFGDEEAYDRIAQVLDRARDRGERISMLRRFTEQYPGSVELKLRLLEELEAAERWPEVLRLARALRADPLSGAGVRTAVGELLLRRGERDDALRAFSEIVEHAPDDELARRRLGDLYLAHGWTEQAYRQYEALRELRPDDPSVLLSLARAAADAGRIDEALRLEQRLMQTAEPGSARGIARVALLWSSLRYARLRADADEARVATLDARRRRSGVLSQAAALRVTLTFAHPDAGVSLWAAHPGEGALARPRDLAPEHGIEVFEADELAAGAYRIEVRRDAQSPAPMEAELCVVWGEGTPSEQVRIVPLRFEGERRSLSFTIDGRALASRD